MNQSKPVNYFFYFLVILILLLGSIYYFNNKSITNPNNSKDESSKLDESKISIKEYKNDLHKITVNYPENWQQLVPTGDKNITEPLKTENIVLFFDALENVDPTTDPLAAASVKINRYVIEKSVNISSQDNWFNYIKEKVNKAKESDNAKSTSYQLISVTKHDDINNLWAVEENYTETGEIKGKDIYIFHDGELYHLICKSKASSLDSYEPYFNIIINSFNIGQ